METPIIAGLDIGSSKTKVIIAKKGQKNQIQILGVGASKSLGFRKGLLINIEKTSESIQQAMEEAEIMAGIQVQEVYVAISGPHIKSQNNFGVIAITNRNQEVREDEIKRVVEAAQTMYLKADETIIHVIPWEFKIDDQDQIRDPIGMKGIRLESKVHIVTTNSRELHNINKSIELCQLKVKDFILSSIASAQAILSDDEKENGALVIDIGSGTTDIILFLDGSIRYTHVFPYAGHHINQDISIAFKIPIHFAENIKINHGACLLSLVDPDKIVEVSMTNYHTKSIKHLDLAKVIGDRLEEILNTVHNNLIQNELDTLISNVVITGGTSLTLGIQQLAEKVFEKPIRISFPNKVSGLKDKIQSPIYSTAVGLVIDVLSQENYPKQISHLSEKGLLNQIKNIIRKFFNEFFN